MKKIDLLIIDPQNDFCAKPGTKVPIFPNGELSMPQGGSLYVDGADQDMERLAGFIKRNKRSLSNIRVTLDSHQRVHVAHPRFWIGRDGQPPPLFTVISNEDIVNGVWRASKPAYQQRAAEYISTLTKNARYPLMIWPEHCLVGSIGTAVHPVLYDALMEWEDQFKRVDFVPKGNNPFTEHYSAVQADVPDPQDPTTQINTRLISVLEQADTVIISGEASTHCVANTVRDIANNFSDQSAVEKFVYLRDTCSPVPIVKELEAEFIKEMQARGMQVSSTTEFMA
jgi:nicotinamidase/pyrazinamidase